MNGGIYVKKVSVAAVIFTLCISLGAILMTTEKAPAAAPSIAGAQTPTDDPGDDNANGCISIEPAVIQVDGQNDITQNITMTLTRDDLLGSGVTKDELELLEVTFSDSCADYIAIDPKSLSIDTSKLQIAAAVTVAGTAPDTTACTLQVADPAGVFDPPLDCEASFAIQSTPGAASECTLTGISPEYVDIGLGLVPKVVVLTITGNDVASFDRLDRPAFNPAQGLYVLSASGSGNMLRSVVVIWGADQGDVAVSVGDCTGGTLTIK